MHIKLKRNIVLYLFLAPLLLKCAYFNTFYNAEEYFKSALNIIENSSITDDSKIPSEAESFFDKTIKNCRIVIEAYPDSKYIDKAYLLMGVSYFYKNSFNSSIENLEKIINSDNLEIKNEAILWTAYSFLKKNNFEKSEYYLSLLAYNQLDREKLFIYHMIMAETNELNNKIDESYSNYLLASKETSKKSRKIYIYKKLIKLAEDSEDLLSKIEFIDLLINNIDDSNKIKDLKIDWIDSKNKLGHYEEVISEIDKILGNPVFVSIEPKLMIYKAKAYKNSSRINLAIEVLNEIVEKFSKKNETSEAYYMLASLSLFNDFDLEQSEEYFDKSIDEKSRSDYAKKSKLLKEKIDEYRQIQDEYVFFKQNPASDTSYVDNENSDIPLLEIDSIALDSLIFNIGQILYFDFNQIDSALTRYRYIVNEFPESNYRKQLLNILEYHDNGLPLDINSKDSDVDSLSILRDRGLSLPSVKESISYFESMYADYADSISLFNAGYMYDNYLYHIDKAVPIYYDIQNNYPRHPEIEYINNRLSELNNNIEELISSNNQKIEFYEAYDLIEENNLDSAKVILQNMEIKRTTPIYASVRDLITYIDQYSAMNDSYIDGYLSDSVIFNMAKIEHYYFDKAEESIIKLQNIIGKGVESDYYYESMWLLSQSVDNYRIDTTLYSLVDTTKVMFYNPIETWDIDKIKSDNQKLDIIKKQFPEE